MDTRRLPSWRIACLLLTIRNGLPSSAPADFESCLLDALEREEPLRDDTDRADLMVLVSSKEDGVVHWRYDALDNTCLKVSFLKDSSEIFVS